jgi:hypothetical protein
MTHEPDMGKDIFVELCYTLIRRFTCRGAAPKAHATPLVDQDEVFEHVVLLLTTVMLL